MWRDIELDGETLKQVDQVKYLGSIFVREGGCTEDVKTRCLKAAQIFYQLSPILGHKEITMTTKTQIIKAVFTPTLLYQSENWTLTSKERQMLTTTKMRCLRKAAGNTRMDNIRNEEIRRRVNMQPPICFAILFGSNHDFAECWSAHSAPRPPARRETASKVCMNVAWLGGGGRVPPKQKSWQRWCWFTHKASQKSITRPY